jgi:hypothetical protein
MKKIMKNIGNENIGLFFSIKIHIQKRENIFLLSQRGILSIFLLSIRRN